MRAVKNGCTLIERLNTEEKIVVPIDGIAHWHGSAEEAIQSYERNKQTSVVVIRKATYNITIQHPIREYEQCA